MNNNIIGIVVGVIVTLLLALYAGTSTAEGSDTPLIIIGAVIFLIVMVALKDKVWTLLVISTLMQLSLPSPLSKFQSFELILVAVIPFYIFNIFFRRATLTWNGNKYCDFFVFLFSILLIALMVRYPVGVLAIEGSEYVNSRAYFDLSIAIVFYITLSTVKTNSSILKKVIVAGVFVALLSAIINIITAKLGFQAQDIAEERISTFTALGTWIVIFCITKYSLWDMVRKPWVAMLVLVGLAGVTMSGFRSQLGRLALIFIAASLVYRRYLDIIIAPIISIGFIIFIAFCFGITKLPAGIQRSISFLPVEVRKDIQQGAEASSEWRFQMWEWALDEKEGYIKDKIWGDGFAQEKEEFIRLNLQSAMDGNNQREFAGRGSWHNGPISAIHRMGIVGLSVILFILIFLAYYSWLAARIYCNQKFGWAVVFYLTPLIVAPIQWVLVFGDILKFYDLIIPIPVVKMLLTIARRENLYIPASKRKEYIPLMIQEAQDKENPPNRKFSELDANKSV